MTDKATVKDLELWASEAADPLIAEGYLMAARTISTLTNAIKGIDISHQEPKDYGWYTECNGCGENLDKNAHDVFCPFIVSGVINET